MYATKLLSELENYDNFEINDKEIILNNEKLVGSDYESLIAELVSQKKQQSSRYSLDLIKFLVNINFPTKFIKNKDLLDLYNEINAKNSIDFSTNNSISKKRKLNSKAKISEKIIWPK